MAFIFWLTWRKTQPIGVILSVITTPGNVNDDEACVECIAKAKERHSEITEAAADAGYDVAEVQMGLSDLGVTSYTLKAPCKSGTNSGPFTIDEFNCDPVSDTYLCPAGQTLRLTQVNLPYIDKETREERFVFWKELGSTQMIPATLLLYPGIFSR